MSVGLFPSLGFGLGYRAPHFEELRAESLDQSSNFRVQWLEALTENYLGLPGQGFGQSLKKLEILRETYPVVLHGVSLSIGGTDPLDREYLKRTAELHKIIDPAWVSDHLCWTAVHGSNSHDLLPLPYTEESISHIVNRIQQVQESWQRPLVIENVSSYVEFEQNEMSESEFLCEIVCRTDCGLLLDVNNIYVSSRNHGFKADEYLKNIPWKNVAQIHLAGHTDKGCVVIDTHDEPVRKEVWDLFASVLPKLSSLSVMIERDGNLPSFQELKNELFYAKGLYDSQRSANPIFL